MFSPLRHRGFAVFWAGQTVSVAGNALHAVALPFQIVALGGGALQLGIGIAIGTGVGLALFPIGGAVVDMLPRRRLLISCDIVSAVAVSAIGLLSWSGTLRMELIYLEAAVLGSVYAFFLPAIRTVVPELVLASELASANALRNTSRQLATVGGAAIGGIAVSVFGLPLAFIADGVTFVVSALAFAASPALSAAAQRRNIFRAVVDGAVYAKQRPSLSVAILLNSVRGSLVITPTQVVLPLFAALVLGGGAASYGMLIASAGVGALVGALVVGQRRLSGARPLFVGGILAGLATVGLAIAPNVQVASVAAACSGIGSSAAIVLWDSLLQRHVGREYLARISSLDLVVSWLVSLVAALLLSAATALLGPQLSLIIAAVGTVLFSSVALLLLPLRRLS